MGIRVDNKDFDEFVRRQQESSAVAGAIDWDKERDQWLHYLDGLYSKIESFLSKYASSGQIKITYESVRLDEEHIGSYAARQMKLRIGRQEVVLLPIGTLLIGAKGRVDVVGPAGKAAILLVDKRASNPKSLIHVVVGVGGKSPVLPNEPQRKIEWEWKILSRPPERRFIEITQETIFQLIMEVANG